MAISIMILGILGLFFLNSKEDKALLYLKRFAVILPLLFVNYDIIAQINYSCDLETYSCEKNWDNNGFDEVSGACVGNGLMDNAFGTSYSKIVEMYNNGAVTGHNGGALTFTAKIKIEDYWGGSWDASEFKNIKFYYKTTQPTTSSPGTLFHTISSWSTSDNCNDHSATFNPGTTISNLYICVTYEVQNGGDHNIWIDEISIVETTGPNTWTGNSSTDWETNGNWSSGSVPTSGDDILIPSTVTDPVISTSVSGVDLTIESGGELTISGSGSITLSGDVDISGTLNYTSSGSITLSKSSGTLSGTGSQTGADYVIASGGSYTLNDSWSIDNMNVNSGGSLDVATTKTLTTATDLTNGGTLTCSGSANLTVGGDVSLTGTTTMGSGTLDLDGDYTNSGTFTSGTSTFKMSGTSQQTINNTNVSVSYTGAGTPTDVLTEGFEGGSLPSGWSQEYVSSTNSWDYDNGAGYTTPGSAYSGSYNAVLFASRGSSTKLITPAINLGSHTSATLTFYHAQTNWGGDQDELRIYYKTSSGGSWTMISGAVWTSEVSSWTKRTVSLPNINSTYYIAFEGYSDYGHGVCIDEIVVNATPNADGSLSLSNEFYDVVINNSNGINLSTADIGYSNNLTLTNGVITTGTDDTVYVESTSTSALPNGSSTSFINGNVKFNIGSNTSIYSIPLGDGTASSDYYRVDLVNNNLAGVDYITARMVTGSPNGYDVTSLLACDDSSTQAGITSFKLKQMASESHLKLTPSSQPTGGTYGLNFYIANFDKSSWSSNKVAIFKRSEGSSDNCAWSVAGTLPADDATGRNITDDYLSFTGANSFSEFGPGGEGGGLLPVTLSNFDATLNDGVVNIVWTTQTEIDNDYFTVERTQDAIEYEDVTEVLGAGNSIVRIDYSATDEEPLYGTSYYRLKQVDYDGTFSYSDIVSIENTYSNLSNFNVYYDGQNIQIRYELDNVVNYSVMVYDISGKLVYNGILNGYVGNNYEVIPFNESVVSGVYSINIIDGNQVFSKNILIN